MRATLTFGLVLAALISVPRTATAATDREVCLNGTPDERITICTKLIQNEKTNPESLSAAHNNRGWGHSDKGEFDKALTDYDEAIRINPKNFVAYHNRGYLHFRRNDFGLARSDLEKSIEVKADYAPAYTMRGRVASALQQHDRAIADHSEAIRISPAYLNAFGNRAHAYLAKRDNEKAIADFRKVMQLPAKTARDRWHQEIAKARIERHEKPRSIPAVQGTTRGAVPSGASADAAPASNASRRVALVIGNSAYANVSALTNPRNDAKAVADMLRRTGFTDVTEVFDLGNAAMSEALKIFGDKAAGADWAVVFFAGHGIEINGTSYLVPIDAKLQRDTHVSEEAVSLDRVQAKVDGASKLGLVILDACRNNPFAARMARAGGATRSIGTASRGLAPVEPEGNVLIAYSAKHGTVAEDGTGRNSPFTEALVTRAEEPNLDVGILFRKVRDDVRNKTQRRQDPFVYGSLGGDLLFLKTAAVQEQK